jgi:thioredoxin-related protein
MRTPLVILQILFWVGLSINSSTAQDKVHWLTWEEAIQKSKTKKKKILVDIYTPWCGWCKKMDKSTYQSPELADYINQHYYAVKFDAESTADIVLNNKTYKYTRYGAKGYHELASVLLQGKLSYPSTVFLDEQMQLIQAIPGFQEINTLSMITTYFASDSHKSIPWQRYTDQFVRSQGQDNRAKRKGG